MQVPENSAWDLGFPQLGGRTKEAETSQGWSLTWRVLTHLPAQHAFFTGQPVISPSQSLDTPPITLCTSSQPLSSRLWIILPMPGSDQSDTALHPFPQTQQKGPLDLPSLPLLEQRKKMGPE